MRLGSGRGRGGPHLGLRFRNIRHLITSAKHDISSNWDILTRNSHPSTNWIYRNSQKLPHFPSIWSQYDHISLTPVQNLLLFLYYLHLYFWPLTGSCRVWKLCTSAYSLQWCAKELIRKSLICWSWEDLVGFKKKRLLTGESVTCFTMATPCSPVSQAPQDIWC